jgi:hypothetical protein
MKITNEVINRKVVGIDYQEYLDYCRERFQIILAKDGIDEIQAITESLWHYMSGTVHHRDLTDPQTRSEVSTQLIKQIRLAANYLELLEAHAQSKEEVKGKTPLRKEEDIF